MGPFSFLAFAVIFGLVRVDAKNLQTCTHILNKENEYLPVVNFSIAENQAEIWFKNETYFVIQNAGGVNLTMVCVGKRPVQLIENYDKTENGLGGVTNGDLPKHLWNEVMQSSDDGETETLYRTALQVEYPTKLCSVSNFSCQLVDDPCLQSNVILSLNDTTDLITVNLNSDPLVFDQLQKKPSPLEQSSGCPIILSYTLKANRYGWKCEAEVEGNHRLINDQCEYVICDSAAHCNTFFHHNRIKDRCRRRLEACSRGCVYANETNPSFKPRFLLCRDAGLTQVQHYFYSVPQGETETPEIYFDWTEADPMKMMWLEPINKDTYVGDRVTVFCHVSRYYFAYGHRFGVKVENISSDFISMDEATDGEYDERLHTNRINVTIHLDSVGRWTVYCFAPVWNSTEWVNKSMVIDVLPDPEPPSFPGGSESSLIWYVGEVNRTIECNGYGKPAPTVQWIGEFQNKGTPNSMLVDDINQTTTMIRVSLVLDELDGNYVCQADNFLGVERKVFRVRVIDPFKAMLKTVLLICFGALILSLFVMILFWKKILHQQKQIRLLTESEVKEFLDGNPDAVESYDYLDTCDLIQCLPYNNSYEIPKEMIHIDQSNVLGSGNFGQVLKGQIQVPHNQDTQPVVKEALKGMNSIDVAVKTVKENMEIVYFKTLLSEVKIMAHIGKHPNIVTLVGACTRNIRKKEIFIAVEFCTNGSLENFLRKHRASFVNLIQDDAIVTESNGPKSYENLDAPESPDGHVLNTLHLIKWSREISSGMSFLGSKKIIHGDLAARNVLLDEQLTAKIGDFGLSRQLLECSNYIKSQEFALPWKWISIESLQDMKFSVHSDVWAYGITIWEIFTLANIPYPGVTWSLEFLDQLCNGMRLHKPSYATTEIYNMMLSCWNQEPTQRPSFSTLKSFFDKLLSGPVGNYFQPTRFSNHDRETGASPLSPDSGIAEDTQGYLVPLLESQVS